MRSLFLLEMQDMVLEVFSPTSFGAMTLLRTSEVEKYYEWQLPAQDTVF